MRLKKLLISSLAAFFITVTVPCFAKMTKEDMVVGGLYIGQRYSEVMDIYGRPSGIMKETEEQGRVFSFIDNGAEFNVRIVNDHVAGVEVFGKNTISTKAGIRIGATVKEVRKTYGEPDEERGCENNRILYYKHDAGDHHTWILAIAATEGKVSSIELTDKCERID